MMLIPRLVVIASVETESPHDCLKIVGILTAHMVLHGLDSRTDHLSRNRQETFCPVWRPPDKRAATPDGQTHSRYQSPAGPLLHMNAAARRVPYKRDAQCSPRTRPGKGSEIGQRLTNYPERQRSHGGGDVHQTDAISRPLWLPLRTANRGAPRLNCDGPKMPSFSTETNSPDRSRAGAA
jgi:hypothetical protein